MTMNKPLDFLSRRPFYIAVPLAMANGTAM